MTTIMQFPKVQKKVQIITKLSWWLSLVFLILIIVDGGPNWFDYNTKRFEKMYGRTSSPETEEFYKSFLRQNGRNTDSEWDHYTYSTAEFYRLYKWELGFLALIIFAFTYTSWNALKFAIEVTGYSVTRLVRAVKKKEILITSQGEFTAGQFVFLCYGYLVAWQIVKLFFNGKPK